MRASTWFFEPHSWPLCYGTRVSCCLDTVGIDCQHCPSEPHRFVSVSAFIALICGVWVALVPFQGPQESRLPVSVSSEPVRWLRDTDAFTCTYLLLRRELRTWLKHEGEGKLFKVLGGRGNLAFLLQACFTSFSSLNVGWYFYSVVERFQRLS